MTLRMAIREGLQRLVRTPLLSCGLLALWLALARDVSLGQVLVGVALAFGLPRMTERLDPTPVRVRRWRPVPRFLLMVGRDVLVSNFQVAWGVVAWQWQRPTSRFVIVPLDLRDSAGLAALAMVTTVVPGTVWSELALDRSALLLHVWDVGDEGAFVAHFKARYEQPLREIFD